MDRVLNVGVIGCGYWGPNLIRNFFHCPGFRLRRIADMNPKRLDAMRPLYPTVELTCDHNDILNDESIDAVAIATPVSTHFKLAMECVKHRKHILVEKPLTSSSALAAELVDAAKAAGVTLMVDHTFVYTPAVRKMRELVTSGELGELLFFDSTRVNLGIVQSDVNVLWDLAVHDLSILSFLVNELPQAVSATGARCIKGRSETIAYLTLHYDSGIIAHCYANWMSPVKIRRTTLGGTKKMVLFDDMEASEKIRIYDSGVNVTSNSKENDYKLMIDYRKGDILIPNLDNREALRTEIEHFRECILTGRAPLSGGIEGLNLVRMLEAASKSLFLKGQPIPL
jgi:predicted dehydrogenase